VSRLTPNVVAGVATAGSLIATALVSVPLILDRVGLTGYGVWTLGLTLVLYVTTAEAGLGPAVQRFVAVAAGAGRTEGVTRILRSTLALYAVAGAVVAGGCALLAPALTSLLDVPPSLRDDATAMFRLVGLVIVVALLVSALGNVQQGLERFRSYAVSAVVGSLVYLGLIVALLEAGHGLPGLALAATGQQVAMLAVRVAALRDVLGARSGSGLRAGERRSIVAFALRLQVSVLSTVVNTQTDKLVVGALTTPATLGLLGIGSQIAEAGRLVGGAALSPLISRLSTTHGEAEPGALVALFARLHRIWLLGIIGATIIGAASLYPLIAAWLGPGHGQAALYGGFLVVAYGLNLLSGTGVAYLRAVGRPGHESRYGALLIVANVVLTIICGLSFGAVGVVAATALAYAVGTGWFFVRLQRAAPELAGTALLPPPRAPAIAFVAGAAALGWGLIVNTFLPVGFALVPVALGAAAALAGYGAWATGSRLSPRALRALLES
jgi:O-antigen/teichoic acid export membrane protein